MLQKIKISIIVPVYNVEKYLKQCLESIKNQSYINFEVIMINDGSTDNSRKICEEYTKDSRFILINQKNQGLSEARNTGLKNISGEYILFVDSDDWIESNCLAECISEIQRNNSDVIFFPYIKEKELSQEKVKLFNKEQVFDKENIKKIILRRLFGLLNEELRFPLKLENLNTAWGKFYKKEIIKEEFIDTKLIGTEDCIFNIYNLINIDKISYIEKTFYHYRKTNINSLTRNYKKNLFNQWIYLYELMENFILKNKLEIIYKKALNNRIILNIFTLVLNILQSNLPLKNQILELKKLLNEKTYEEIFRSFSFKFLPLSWKIFYFLCKNKNSILLLIYTKIGLKLKGEK